MTGRYHERTILEMLQRQRLGVLATTGLSGPRTALVAFAFAEEQKRIFFFTPRDTNKYANVQSEPRVSLLVDDRCVHPQSDNIVALMATGMCKESTPELRQTNMKLLQEKIMIIPEEKEQALMYIDVERLDAVTASQHLRSIVF